VRYFREGPPPPLRVFGIVALTAIVVASLLTEPRPGFSDDGPLVLLGVVLLIGGIALSAPRREIPPRRRTAGLVAVAAAVCVLSATQPNGAALGAMYYVVIVAALALDLVPALVVAVLAIVGAAVVAGLESDQPGWTVFGILVSVIPWFLVMRLVRQIAEGREEAERLVEELRESRAAHAESAAVAECGRVARDMHDVLAHSLSALALQLEGSRLLAAERGADPDVVAAIERAHHLAADALSEARDAIAALRGDALPGPERLSSLANAFPGECRLAVVGAARELGSEARLAVYRTAQEALTNVLRHSDAELVELRLAYEADGVRLVVEDHGPGAPVAVGAPGGGYGLTGMRERAELLGGRLSAAPTRDGFRVELWLPA
jgi:signal transduction histidine kinase